MDVKLRYLSIMNEIHDRSRYIDDLENVMNSCATAKFLFYYRPLVLELVEDVLRDYPTLINATSFLPMAAGEFLSNASLFYAREVFFNLIQFERVRERSFQFVDEYYTLVSKYAVNFFQGIALQRIQLSKQVSSSVLHKGFAGACDFKYSKQKRERQEKKRG
jgi:hypothetical protein